VSTVVANGSERVNLWAITQSRLYTKTALFSVQSPEGSDIRPDAVENEEELDKDAAERQNATHQDARHCADVHGLLRDLTRNLIGAHWMLDRLDTHTTVVT